MVQRQQGLRLHHPGRRGEGSVRPPQQHRGRWLQELSEGARVEFEAREGAKGPRRRTSPRWRRRTLRVEPWPPRAATAPQQPRGSNGRKEEKVEFEGEVLEAMRNRMFRIKLDNGHETLGYMAGRMKRYRIRVFPGDRVRISCRRRHDLAAARRLGSAEHGVPPLGGRGRADRPALRHPRELRHEDLRRELDRAIRAGRTTHARERPRLAMVAVEDVRECWATFERLGNVNRHDLLSRAIARRSCSRCSRRSRVSSAIPRTRRVSRCRAPNRRRGPQPEGRGPPPDRFSG